VPDELARPGPSSGRRIAQLIDLLDGYFEFAERLPGLLHQSGPERGFPLSWRHYLYGMGYLARAKARHDVQLADAAAIPMLKPQDRMGWYRERIDIQRRG
jgi:hypothetical protein